MKSFIVTTCVCFLFLLEANAQKEGQWKPLFGKDLQEANYDPAVWSMKDGVLSAIKDESIWTKIEYDNFELDLEFKTDVETNSGVVIFCTDTKDWIPNSVEIQIADDYCEKWGNSDPTWKCGAVFGHLAAKRDRVVKRPGEWNRMRVKCIGKDITIELNGEVVTEMDMSKWTSGIENPDGSSIPSWLPKPFAELPTKGYIGLQGKHGNSLIWFKNMEIRTL